MAGFGYWINPDKEIIDDNEAAEKIAKTLEKSHGDIDWEYGLMNRLPVFATKNGKTTIEIISSYLLDSSGNLNQNRRTPLLDNNKIKDALKIVYTSGNAGLKQEIVDLINILIMKGSSMFWDFKEVLDED